MTGGYADYQGSKRRVYRCRRRHAHGDCPAPATAAELELLELAEPVFWRVLNADTAVSAEDRDADGERLTADAARARRALEVYRDATDLVDLDPVVFADGLRVHQLRRDKALSALAAWRRDQQHQAVDVAELRTAWDTLTPGERRNHLADVIGAVVVKRPEKSHRGHVVPLRGRAFALLVDDLPGDLPHHTRRLAEPRAFPPFDDEATPWIPLGE